jgi:hypothetical protein
MANLLQKASIVLTPTAYDDGKVLCAKPSEPPYGDFDFSRNSAATRVNAQGLVENVQILSSNLVQNGSFSEEGTEEVSNGSFSQEGSELVTNGNFDTDSDWFKSGQVTIGGGVAYFDSDGTFTQIAQNLSGISGKSAKVVIEITEYNQGTLKVLFSGGAQQNLPTSVGTHTLYFSNVASNTLNIARVGGVTNIKIDNISVKEVIDATNIPRIDYTDGTASILLEGQSTNLVTYSSDFSQSVWSKIGLAVNSNQVISPDGSVNADEINITAANAHFLFDVISVSPSTNYTFTFYAKKGTATDASYSILNETNFTNIVNTTSYFNQISNTGWTRISVEFTTPVGCNSIRVYPLRDGSSTGTIYIFGAQVEALPYPTSYIPTSGAIATRLADSVTGAGDATTFNSDEGVLYAEISTLNGDSGSNRTISLSDSTNGNQIRFYFPINVENQIKIRVDVGGSTIYVSDYNIATSETPIKLAFRYSPNGMDVYGNGALVSSSLLFPNFTNNLNRLQFKRGDAQSGEDFFGKVKSLITYNTALTDAELECLTTI